MTAEASPVRPVAGRAGFAVALACFTALTGMGIALGRTQHHPPPLAVVVIAGVVATAMAAMLLRYWRPVLVYAVITGGAITVIGDGRSANLVWFALLLVTGWCSLTADYRAGLTYLLASLALFAVEWAWINRDPGWGAWLGGDTFMFGASLLIQRQFSIVAQLRAAQAGLAAKARAEERNRISRDLHDVIAHTLTVSLLHVMSARLAVEHDPADAARALAEAERLGRESLAEVRQVVGMLGADDAADADADGLAGPPHGPLPGVPELSTLVERFRAARLDVMLTVYGDTGRLPATVGLAVYRILQEALTNVLKHAPGAPTTAVFTVSAREAVLTVDSLGPPGDGSRPGSGHGVASMRERAESLGGSCQAGPSGAGWLVRATFPLAAPEDAP